ncbi:hypothetical protein SynWH8103_00717 [Synechococcus sp. WH 8103]|nr:hypothetical protein SynWH8103_00717 [Synechococcus sp. WH 8103]
MIKNPCLGRSQINRKSLQKDGNSNINVDRQEFEHAPLLHLESALD